jgi:hypothetical protein
MASGPTSSVISRRVEFLLIVALWVLLVAAMLYGYRAQIADLLLADPDDSLRLVQVRDLLAGQAWHDLSQYRINPAEGGGQLHWSRFIDAQIAALIWTFQFAMDPVEAERWALVAYPMLLLLLLLALFRRILGHLGDSSFIAVGMIMAATTFSFLHYFVPLRIDHHNWQLLLSMTMLWLALGPGSIWRGLAAALAISLHLEISLEGLPYLVIFGALFAYDWLRDPATAPRLRGFALGLVFVPTLWVAALRGFDAVTGVYCDAFSRPYLAGAALTGLILFGVMGAKRWQHNVVGRLAILGFAGVAGAITFALSGPACLAGPFGNLSPLVREFWYEGISEGHPIWEQTLSAAASFGLLSVAGLIGLFWTARREAMGPYAADWHRLLMVSLASFVLSLFVLRTTSVTHAYVLPGYVLAVMTIFRWGRSFPNALQRIPATAASVLAFPIALSALVIWVMSLVAPDDRVDELTKCLKPNEVARLNSVPDGTMFALLDISSAILAGSHHKVVATGHHRNHLAIHRVISGFLATPADAEKLVRGAQADYIAICPKIPEFQNLVRHAPKGLAKALADGNLPGWLAPISDQKNAHLRIYQVLPPVKRPE